MSSDRLYQRIDPAGAAAVPQPATSIPPLTGRTWLEAALALLGDRHLTLALPDDRHLTLAQPAKARVYRTPATPASGLDHCWRWRCDTCGKQGNGCYHTVLHEPGTWTAAMCGGLRHVHRKHPRPAAPGQAPHTTLFGRRRCSITTPSRAELDHARAIVNGTPGTPTDPEARAFAREILALAGYQR